MGLSTRQIRTAATFWSALMLVRRPQMRAEVRERFEERLMKFLADPPAPLGFDGVHLGTEVTPDAMLALAAEQAGIAIVGHDLWPWYHTTRFTDDGLELRRGKDAEWETVPLVEGDEGVQP